MSKSESAIVQGGDGDDDCPLCLEPLPPFWAPRRRVHYICCGGEVCKTCVDKTNTYLKTAAENGLEEEELRQLEQLENYCPLCRSKHPDTGSAAIAMIDRFEKGRLPLKLYGELGTHYLDGMA